MGIQKVRVFAGQIESESPAFQGLCAPATLTIAEEEAELACTMVFFTPEPVAVKFRSQRGDGAAVKGVAQDQRGWEVAFEGELVGDCVTGTYRQPHDWGTFDLKAV